MRLIALFLLLASSLFADTSGVIVVGRPVSITVEVVPAAAAPFSYQWKKNGTDIAGANGPTYTIAAAQLTDAGIYVCSVWNKTGSVSSDQAILVAPLPPGAATTRLVVNGVEQPKVAAPSTGLPATK